MFGRGEQNFQLQPTPMWVHLTYQTAFVDNAGKLQIRRDVYNLDSRTLAAIKRERGSFEAAPERKREPEVASGPAVRRAARPARPATPPAPSTLSQSMPQEGSGFAWPFAQRSIYR